MRPIRAWRHTKSLSVIRRGKAEGLITRSPARKTKGQRETKRSERGEEERGSESNLSDRANLPPGGPTL